MYTIHNEDSRRVINARNEAAHYTYDQGRKEFELVHGNAYDRGRADAYYSRYANPHKYTTPGPPRGDRVEVDSLTDYELLAYFVGYFTEPDRKFRN